MKKYLLFPLLFIIISNMKAQNSGDIEFGLGGGINLSFLTDTNDQNSGSKISNNFIAVGEYYFSDRLGLRIKTIYDNKGYQGSLSLSETVDNETFHTDFILNYLTIPITSNFHFSRNRNWFLNLGPYIGFLLNAEGSGLEIDVNELYKKVDIGVSFGIGYKFNINKNMQLFSEYDAQIGISEVFEKNQGEKIRNRRSSLNIGLLLNL
ncbi:porin family protein [Wenyingzhuangia sp. IMCC45574]